MLKASQRHVAYLTPLMAAHRDASTGLAADARKPLINPNWTMRFVGTLQYAPSCHRATTVVRSTILRSSQGLQLLMYQRSYSTRCFI